MPRAKRGEKAAPTGEPALGISADDLTAICEAKDDEALAARGGAVGVAAALACSLATGVDQGAERGHSLAARRAQYGVNRFKEVPVQPFWRLLIDNLSDPTLILLMCAAAVSTTLGAVIPAQRAEQAWTEGVAIWVAVIVVSFVASGNDYQKDQQFRKLNKEKDSIEVKAVRGGLECLVTNTDVVVGDILLLDTGDKLVADGIAVEAFGLVIDEASLTGESEPIRKSSADPWCRSGTQVTEGSGRLLVLAVGERSEWGRTMAMVASESAETPLQEALGLLAAAIGKVGLLVGGVCFIVLLIRWCVQNRGFPVAQIASGPLTFFIFAVTIVVVAVPEGLPLAVTISLAYSMEKMMKDNNFVRVLAACETMGGATTICSDKTGTLTENRMAVVAGWFAGAFRESLPALGALPPHLQHVLSINIALNSKAFLISQEKAATEFVGNRTECALLVLLRGWGVSYEVLRTRHADDVEQRYAFSSERKMASVLMRTPSGFCLYNKGASEIVLERCTGYLDAAGQRVTMSEDMRSELEGCILSMARTGLRTLCLAVRELPREAGLPDGYLEAPPDEDMALCAIVGIKDPVRKEVPDAVATCQRAGIMVRMVTGDNLHTAMHIAAECGILAEGGLALEGPTFRSMSEEELIPLLPQLQVLARSSPHDKYHLVQLLKKTGDIVAVTGDGTNDAPALKESDVGLAMGIAGTEVAKEAADIVIMDDNFSSIVKSVLWGRSVFSNIRKFLQFQLTVNFVALVIAFVAAVSNGETPLNVLELLWVNLIMDAMAALALATEMPMPELLLEKPHGRNEPLISRRMWKHVIVQGLYQLFWLFLIIYGAPAQLPTFALPSPCAVYANVDASGIDLSPLAPNDTFASPAYNYAAPWPPGSAMPAQATCRYGPCINTCCTGDTVTGACTDNLAVDGGHYQPTDVPLCVIRGLNTNTGQLDCYTNTAANHADAFCLSQPSDDCARLHTYEALQSQAMLQMDSATKWGQANSNSLVFNTFIFMQIFNEFNARKIQDELNVFEGIWQSRTFLYIEVITVAFQVIIMTTPIAHFFRCAHQDGFMWLFAVGVGAGSLLVSFLTKVLTRDLKYPRVSFTRKAPSEASLTNQRRTASRSTFNTLTRSRSTRAAPRITLIRPASKFGASPSLGDALAPPLRVTLDAASWPRASALGGERHRSLNPNNPVLNPGRGLIRTTLDAAAWPRAASELAHRPSNSGAAPRGSSGMPPPIRRPTHVKFEDPALAVSSGGAGSAAAGGSGVEDERALLLPHMAQPAEHIAVDIGAKQD